MVPEAERPAPCRNLPVVCHGGVIRAILQHYLKLDPENIIPVAPASLSAIRLSNGHEKPPASNSSISARDRPSSRHRIRFASAIDRWNGGNPEPQDRLFLRLRS